MTDLRFRNPKGFTLIELMVVVLILALLASLAIPKFNDMVKKAREAQVKGHLAHMRSGMTIYYADTDGLFPHDFNILTTGAKYMKEIPFLDLTKMGHPAQAFPRAFHKNNRWVLHWTSILDSRDEVWWYGYRWTGTTYIGIGKVVVNCTHEDTAGNAFSTW
jgi:prepilin-type N-terminal cleavage/methylation domain-containing protein